MADQPYPIHDLLDQLIQEFKTFQTVAFPRGIPEPIQDWKPLLQSLTQYDAKVAQPVSHYLCGASVDLSLIPESPSLETLFASIRHKSSKSHEYMQALTTYQHKIDHLKSLLLDCAEKLGNPCKIIKNS